MPVIEAPETPVVVRAKSDASTPRTFSLNATVHCTLAALVGVEPTRLIDDTVGGVVSIVAVHVGFSVQLLPVSPPKPPEYEASAPAVRVREVLELTDAMVPSKVDARVYSLLPT